MLLACVATIALGSPALAGTYTATDDASLRSDITTANGDGAASSTITLANDVTMTSTSLPVATKDLTIDSGSFSFLKTYAAGTANQGVVSFSGAATGIVTLKGKVTGVSGGGSNTGQYALVLTNGTNVVNDAILIGGNGSASGLSGLGASVTSSTLTNNGTITGGSTGSGGNGVQLFAGATLINAGALQGGNSTLGGSGVTTSTSASTITNTNTGTIRGGTGTTIQGGVGIQANFGSQVTNSGTISGGDGVAGGSGVNLIGTASVSGVLNNSGTITGGNASNGAGGNGLNSTGSSAAFTDLVSNTSTGTITGGDGTTGNGGVGAALAAFTALSNDGTITGGNSASAQGGSGVTMKNGSTLTNNGTIQGGSGATGGGYGLDYGGPGATALLTNKGTIRGNANIGVLVRNGAGVLTNSGTIEGGANFAAISDNSLPALTIVNSGAIKAGVGAADAIAMATFPTQTLNLELQAGSVITGNVAANTGVTNTLTLGGDSNASFDVSKVGPQYQNFTVFNKTGNSIWSLTGTGSIATPWTISAGTLQLGDGTTNGSILGDVTDNATLAFNNSASTTYAGAISGTGNLVQAGSGTTILTGASNYSGGTTISAGTLQIGNGGTAGSITGDVTDNGTLAFNRSDSVTFGNVVSGTGTLVQAGSGTLILTGSNSYSGGTTISAGTLQIGNGGTAGSITGNVTNNGALVFDRSDAVTYAGAISGTGSVAQIAAGNLTLTGANSYSGGTIISAGTVTGSATSFGSGAITDNAALVIDQPSDSGFANAINGSGSFTKLGAGRLNYTGTGSLSGPTTVAAGLLSVNGSLASSAVTVAGGATLGGNGSVGTATIQSGGTIAPGNSIGTLHVNGAFVQSAGSLYRVEVDPTSNASDLILVNGTATIQGGATLNVVRYQPGNYQVGAQYTVLTASGGVTGSYALSGETAVSQYLALQESQDASNIYLRVVQTGDPATAATTPNQTAVAQAVDSLPPTASVPSAILNSPSEAVVRPAFDALSGEALASAKGVLISSSVLVRDTTLDRLRDVFCMDGAQGNQSRHAGCVADRPSVWAQGFGDWGHVFGTANAAGVAQTTAGFLTGVDIPVYDWRIGVFGGYSRTDFDVGARASSGASNSYHLGLYGGTAVGDFKLRLGAGYSWSGIDTERLVAFNNFSNDLRARYNAGTTQLFGEIGNSFQAGRVALEPFASLAYVGVNTDGFSEVGGDAALTSRRDVSQDMFTTLGVRPSTEVMLGSVSAVLRGMAGWRHTFGDITPSSMVSFAGSKDFAVTGAPIAKNAGVVEVGLGADISSHAAIGLTYGGQFSDRQTDHSIRGTITVSF